MAACPDSDADKSTLVEEMMISHSEGISTPRCEARHPFVLSLSFINLKTAVENARRWRE